ncbi:MAG: hypothetical protein O4808_20715 [Trichodesmium sp. St17_bin3_1_1]|nr:hypothetical protein [Trichodesmium sp. St17_bin3_1_1]
MPSSPELKIGYSPRTGVKGLITITFTIPESIQRREYWQTYLNKLEISIEKKELDILSDRFRLTPDQIADAAATAYNTTRWQQISETKAEYQNIVHNQWGFATKL